MSKVIKMKRIIFSLCFSFIIFPLIASVFIDPSLQFVDSFIRSQVVDNLFLKRRQVESSDFLVRRRRADGSEATLQKDSICKNISALYNQDKEEDLKKSTSEFIFDEELQNIVLL